MLLFSSCTNKFTSLIRNGGPGAHKVNPVLDLPHEKLQHNELFFSVEKPQGARLEYQLRAATGQIMTKHKACGAKGPSGKSATRFKLGSGHRGITPGRFDNRGRPLGMIVFGNDKKYLEMAAKNRVIPQKVRIIGLLKADNCPSPPCLTESKWQRNWQIIAVDPLDLAYQFTHSLVDLKKEKRERLRKFWHYRLPEKRSSEGDYHPRVRVTGFDNIVAAKNYLKQYKILDREDNFRKCVNHFQKALFNKNTLSHYDRPKKDPLFLECLNRIWYPHFFLSKFDNDFFMNYSAYQLIRIKLKQNVKYDNALAYMKHLKNQKSPYYRFVSYDVPGPGTGNAIYEWVKSNDRWQNCHEKKRAKYYTQNPLIDFQYD